MSQAAVVNPAPAQTDTTQFDMSSAVPETEDGKAVSAMPAFDLSSAVPEDQISRAQPKSWEDQVMNFISAPFRKSPEDRQAEAANIYAISKSTGMSMEDVSKNYDQLSRNPKITGMMPEPTKGQVVGGVMMEGMLAPVAAEGGIAAGALLTAKGIAGLGVFTGINALVQYGKDKLLPQDTNQGAKDAIDLAGLALGGLGAHAAGEALEKGVGSLVDSMVGNVIPHAPDAVPTMDLAAEHIKAITDSKLPDEAKQDLLGRLGVTQDHIDASVASGKPIRVPFTNVINMAQSPHWDDVAGEITENGLPKTGIETPEVKAVLLGEASPDNIPNAEGEQQGNFGKGQSPLLLDYLAQYLPPKVVASLTNDERLKLANGPWQDLRDFASQFEGEKNLGVKGPDYYKNLMLKGELNGYFSGEEEGGKGKVKNTSNVSLAEVEKQVRSLDTENLESLMDTRYEAGASQKELDFLENIYAERISEEELNMSEDNEQSEKELEGNGRYGVDLESQLEDFYSQFKLPVNERDGQYTDKELIDGMRSNLAHGYGSVEEAKSKLENVSDEDIVNAAKDVAEWKEKLNERRAAKGEPVVESKVEAEKPISPMTGGLQEETGKFGEHNTLFTEEMANEAREAFNKKTSGLHSGIDPTAIGDLLKIGGYHFEGGVREFGAWSEKVINEMGERVRPYLKQVWDDLQKQAPKMAQPKVEATESELNKNKYVKPVKLDFVGKEKKGSIDFRRTGDDMRKKFIGAINEAKTKVNYLAEDNARLVKDVTQRNGQAIYADRGGDIEAIKKDMEDIESSLEEGSESEKWWNEEGKSSYEAALNPTEEMLQGIKEGNQYYKEAGQVAKYHKTISTVRDNYVNRAWRRAVSKGLIETDKHDNPSGYTGHRQNRVFPFIADGIKAKFIPETLDYSKLMSMHGEEMAYANVGNAFAEQSIPLKFGGWVDSDSVKEGQMQVGTMKRDLPQKNKDGTIKINPKTGNQEIRHQVFVAPEGIAKAMGPVVDPDFLRQIDQFQNAKGLNQVVKNANVMLGMFHDKQFIIQELSSISGPEGVKDALTGKIPEKLFTEDFRKDELEYIKTGLGTTPEYENVDIAKDMDKIEGSLKDAPGIKQANALIDAHTKNLFNVWGRYFKVDNFIRNKAVWDLKNPNATPQERVEAYRGIAQAANNTFGGHGWAGLGVSKSITSAARFTFFASDWLYSAVRNTGAAVGDWKVGNWRTVADSSGMEGHIARTTILKGLLYGAVATEGINYMLTGHTTDKNSKGHKLEVEFDNNTHLSLFGGATGELVKFLSDFGERGIDGATNYFTYKASPVMRLLGMVATHKNYAGGDIWSEDGGAGKFLADHVPEQYQDGVKHAVNGMVELLSTISPIPFAAEPAILGKIGSDIKDMATNSGENLGDKIKKGVGDVGLVTGLTRYSVGESDARKQQDIDTEVEKGLEKKDDTAANKYLASGDISQAKIDELQAKADETPLEKSYKNLSVEKILKKADGNIDSMDADDKDSLKTILNDKYDRMVSANKASPNEIKRIGDLLTDFYEKHKIQ